MEAGRGVGSGGVLLSHLLRDLYLSSLLEPHSSGQPDSGGMDIPVLALLLILVIPGNRVRTGE